MWSEEQQPAHSRSAARAKIATLASWTGFEVAVYVAYGIISIPLVAVLLGPYELGKAGLVMAVVNLMELLFAAGISDALVQARFATRKLQASAHTVLLIAGVLGCAAIVASARPIAWMYGDRELEMLLIVGALLLPLNSTMAVPTALMTRKLRARPLSLRNILARSTVFAVTLSLAYSGRGALSAVVGSVAGSVVSLLFMLPAVTRAPLAKPSWLDLKPLLSVGTFIGAENIIANSSYRLFVMLIAYIGGMSQAGYFQLGQRPVDELAAVSQTVVQRFGAAYFANLKRRFGNGRKPFLAANMMLASITFPMFAGLAACAHDIAVVLFGARWLAAVPVLQMTAFSWIMATPAILIQPFLRAQERQELVTTYVLIAALIPPVVFLALGTDPFIAAGMAWASRHLLAIPASVIAASYLLALSPRQFARPFLIPASACIMMVVGVELWRAVSAPASFLSLAGCIAFGALLYAGALFVLERRCKLV
jgi:O-antigen/teichoic acid export membrane protein